jgi:hypothetical protein|nr:MAG TPA: ChiA1-BD-binding domain protein [Caudoviricetes sp.]
MYEIIKSVISSKDYKLEDILYKISKMYIEDRITESEKSELDELARSNVKAENSYDMQKQLDNLEARVKVLEEKGTTDEPGTTEEYPEYIQPTGAHDAYQSGDKITFNGKKYICKMDNCVWSPETYPAAWEEVEEA